MEIKRTPNDIIKAYDTKEKLINYLENRTKFMAILFIDMCGSTALKRKPQSEWLPIICRFLLIISNIIIQKGGRVVKYIGDEVFSVFPEDENEMATFRAENCIWECEAELKRLGEDYKAKYTLDYGKGATVDFNNTPQDVLGTCIDRCARIATIVEPTTALASKLFVEKSKHKESWSLLGDFSFKGIGEKVGVYQFKNLGKPMQISNFEIFATPKNVLIENIKELETKLNACIEELHVHRSK